MPDFGIFRGFSSTLFSSKLFAGQLPIEVGSTGSEGFSFDPDYQAILDYATTQGYTLPSAAQQTLQNQLVLDLKDAGIWTKLDTFAVFATDGNSDFALIDWKRLTQYTAVNSPTFTTNKGFTGNGTSSYINTNFSTTISGRENNATMGVGWFTNVGSTVYLCGQINNNRSNLAVSGNTNNGLYNTSGTTNTPSYSAINGALSIVRNSSEMLVYRDNALVSTLTGYNTDSNGGVFVILRTVSGLIYSNRQIQAAWFATALTNSETFDLHQSINNYYSSL